jgi:flagellar basal-body rod modification protein FlgD
MSTTDPLSALAGLSGTGAAKSTPQLGQNEFLKLMITQLKNQDPFKPADPTAFIGQLAQFSTVTGIQGMQKSVSDLATSLRSNQVLNGATLVGRDVLAPATKATLAAGGVVNGAVETPSGASAVQVSVNDASGALVRRFSITPGTGLTDFTWNGLDNNGDAAPAGQYKFSAIATVDGTATSLDPLLTSRVASVSIDSTGGSLTLNTSSGAVPITDVRRVL